MKNLCAIAIVIAVVGSAQAQLQTTPLFPLKVGKRWTYVVTNGKGGKEDVKKTVTVEVERQEPFGKNIGFILKNTSGAKVTRDHVVVLDDGVYKVHVAETKITPPLCFIKLGPAAGKGWEANSKSGNTTIKGAFTVKSASVTVPAGTFKDAFLISFNNNKVGADRVEIDTWYAIDIGMVRQRVLQKGTTIMLELEK